VEGVMEVDLKGLMEVDTEVVVAVDMEVVATVDGKCSCSIHQGWQAGRKQCKTTISRGE